MSVQPHGIYAEIDGKIWTAMTWSLASIKQLVVDYKQGRRSKEAPNSDALYATNTSTAWYTEDPVCLLLLIYDRESWPEKPFCRTLWWHSEFNLWPLGYKMSWNHLHYPVRHLLEIFVIMTQKLSNRSQQPWHLSCDSTHHVILVLGSICSFLPKFTHSSQCTNILTLVRF